MFTKHNYPKDWYKHLKPGDTIKCVKITNYYQGTTCRPIGSELKIHGDKRSQKINYTNIKGQPAWTNEVDDFVPIKMSAFTDNQIKDCYDVY